MKNPPMPAGEKSVLCGIILFALATFLPWTHNADIAGVGLIAWMMWVLLIAAPLAGLVLTLTTREKD
ncbi:hypothetical protein ONR57_18060 [Hoyosella sp. YIM 151337]|uniref:hypothetical protein n=1 Tax=Hoyosella sp. YIM 151337 TaxID=2992742 RepID=UPI0022364900|nr:hypothetical protein [Hoyosella sp. YIM 151337]MCW4355212.1 hypothetical protein [Hoyosella sp. YIM 151337]